MGVLTFAATSYLLRSAYQRLERRGVFRVDQHVANRPTAWIDGLRGIAALGLLASSLSQSLVPSHFSACCGADQSSSPSLWQLPPLKLLAAGKAWTALFFVLSGLSCSLASLRLARSDRVETAYSSLGRSALRRPLRLLVPFVAASALSWILSQLGLFTAAQHTRIPPLSVGASTESSFLTSLWRSWRYLEPGPATDGLTTGSAAGALLHGPFLLYAVLLTTLSLRPTARTALVAVITAHSLSSPATNDQHRAGPAFLLGLLLAELWTSTEARARLERIGAISGPIFLTAGIVIMSWADDGADKLSWTRSVRAVLLSPITPSPAHHDPERLTGAVGASLLVLGAIAWPRVRVALARPLMLWLGNVAFGIYLLHLAVLRVLAPWLLFVRDPVAAVGALFSGVRGDDFVRLVATPGVVRGVLGVVVLVLAVLSGAQVWMRRVEPVCKGVAERMIDWAVGRNGGLGVQGRSVLARDEPTSAGNGFLPVHNKSRPV